MKFTSTLIAAASGSVAGATFSRNRGGPYIRRRAIPSNPNSEAQGIARANLATSVAMWTNGLSNAARQGWITYAQATPVIDPLGQQITLSGQQMYVRSNTVNLIMGNPSLTTLYPITSGLGLTPDWTADPSVDASTQLIVGTVAVESTVADWQIAVYMSRPVPGSRVPNHETRRFAETDTLVDGVADVSATCPFVVSSGQRVRVLARALDSEGRLSSPTFRDVLVQA